MKYPRPKFGDPSIKLTNYSPIFGNITVQSPVFDTPISTRENFIRAAHRDKPMWVPFGPSEIQSLHINQLASPRGEYQLGPDFKLYSPTDYTFLDPFGNSWTWVASAGGAMLTPGTKVVDDICDWEKQIKFPNFNDWDFKETAEKFMQESYDPNKVMHINIHQGLTEMLVAFLGGYEEGMTALAIEPEACQDFFNRYAQYMIDFFDMLNELYPIDFITYHDDWGTEKDTFFSERMMEELVFEPTKRIVDHIKGKGKVFELHSCGKIERFLPYMCDLGVDFLQIQRRANDMPKLKQVYGDRIGFNAFIEDMEADVKYSEEELRALMRKSIDIYAPGGGFYPVVFASTPEDLWTCATEIYCYSRELYDKENGR
jgi:hypothetical protein